MSTTPFMGLVIPTVSVTLGPLWASMLNTAFDLVDSHDHTPGNGAPIGAAAVDIDSDLSFNSFNATTLRTLRLSDQTSIVLAGTDLRSVYSKNGDLYYRNAALAEVQLTSGSALAGIPGSITGLVAPAAVTYSPFTSTFSFTTDTSKAAMIASSDLVLYEFNNATAQPITIRPPAGVIAYLWTLPAAGPASSGLLGISNTGQIQYGAPDGTQALPGMSFGSDLNTGFYRSAPDVITVSNGNSMSMEIAATYTAFVDGSQTNPSITFLSDIDTGMYRVGANQIGFSVGGSNVLSLSSTGLRAPGGSGAPNPAYTFSGVFGDMGMYNDSGDVAFSTGGVKRAAISSGGISSGSVSGSFTPIKWYRKSGTTTSGVDHNITVTGATAIVGATGVDTSAGEIMSDSTTADINVIKIADVTSGTVTLRQDSGSNSTYQIVIFYI